MARRLLPIELIKGARQMKAVVMHEYGGPDVLKYEDVPDPVPGKGEVLIRIAAASINPVDLWQRAGATKASLRVEFPAIIGWDLSGTVVGPGPDVREFAVGDRVFAWAFHTCSIRVSPPAFARIVRFVRKPKSVKFFVFNTPQGFESHPLRQIKSFRIKYLD